MNWKHSTVIGFISAHDPVIIRPVVKSTYFPVFCYSLTLKNN